MTLNPDVQVKAQVEIDRVLENRRLPDVSDHDSLPYVAAIMREVLRYVSHSSPVEILFTRWFYNGVPNDRWQPSSPQGKFCSD